MMTTEGAPALNSLSRLATSMPFMPGILQSIK
jgi:hypothetical protein